MEFQKNLQSLLSFINNLEVTEVDLDKESELIADDINYRLNIIIKKD